MYFTHPQFNKLSLKPFFRKFSEKFLLEKLNNIFPNSNIVFTDSGRSAFQLAIESLNLQNTEMIVPAYICDIFRPILKHYNIKPIHIDTNFTTFQADTSEIETQITPNTKSILICHTYGLPVDMENVSKIARNYNLKIIEDCAHILPHRIYGDCAFFSFMKLFPVTNGGMLVSKNPININLEKYVSTISEKIKFLRLFPKFANFSEKFRPEEKLADRQRKIPKNISRLTLKIIDYCFDNFNEQLNNKIELAKYFQAKLSKIDFKVQESENNHFTYLSALVPENIDRNELFYKLKERHIFCSRIWQNPLLKQLPNTSVITGRIINLPLQNWYTKQDIDNIIEKIIMIMNEM
ncbi:MAG TPA: DegT/DnrJ/EryC1/StrS family aminotransferase [Candidatus Portnoybacteria bacterium]|jgi:perosamine synthetase|nr:DegT/DnrJ/EryC1/StrS family aminotransferase [Candidatus Portnoybacteria bacterium]MDD5752352.1 DegT/DnrJ/EryC1/StrS family aminotransferase [Candidatus Portnoybacteria bacterium]HNU96852.1 DegT/DnrJ/EryC1/StrS family aminotransferase [Candidatus Portnoybacteria bacterium]HPH52339.1 DegT/DnrJ/EryC1/StrS family aminotransferase [Candidatus Portnoybacteria bacterium]HPM28548.1 DegT/DnrJ/EryC1/StrS family aminotransferase [Candidatus Portnoybacteria bacterium]